MNLASKFQMDICLINIDDNLNKSLISEYFKVLWLQTHFEDDQWEALSNHSTVISQEN